MADIPNDINEWGAKFSLGEGALRKVVEEGFTSMDIVRLMSDKHIKALKLNMGQSLALEHAIKSITPADQIRHEDATSNADQPARDSASSAEAFPDQHQPQAGGNLASLLESLKHPEEPGHAETRPSGKDKPLFVQDFCGVQNGSYGVDREVMSLGGDSRLMLVSSARKVTPENTTLPQWIKGHLKIQQVLIDRGELSGTVAISAYARYGMKIADMCAIYPVARVMRYDAEYRIKVFEGALQWGEPDPELMNFCVFVKYLSQPERTQKPTYPKRDQRDQRDRMASDPNSGKEICRNFNIRKGCNYRVCRFAHVCSKCYGSHAEVDHA